MLVKESIIYLKCGVSTLEHVNLLWCLFASSPVKHLLQKTNTKATSIRKLILTLTWDSDYIFEGGGGWVEVI